MPDSAVPSASVMRHIRNTVRAMPRTTGSFLRAFSPSENPHTKESMLTASAVEKRKSKSIVLSRNVLESAAVPRLPLNILCKILFRREKPRIEA